MRMNLLQMAVLSIAALLFIHAALGIMTFCDKKICRKKGQIFYLNLLVLLMVCMTEAFHSPNRAMHILGLNILLTMALIDETTGYVYDVWNWLFLSICAFPGFVLQEWSSEKMLAAVFYFAAVFLCPGKACPTDIPAVRTPERAVIPPRSTGTKTIRIPRHSRKAVTPKQPRQPAPDIPAPIRWKAIPGTATSAAGPPRYREPGVFMTMLTVTGTGTGAADIPTAAHAPHAGLLWRQTTGTGAADAPVTGRNISVR